MITLFKRLYQKLLYDELAVRRWARSLMFSLCGIGVAFADQLSSLIESTDAVKTIKIVGVVCGALGGAITAGEKNKKPDAKD